MLAAVKSGAAQMRGVNFGSWLVLESWMTPQPWSYVSGDPYGEYLLMEAATAQGQTAAVTAAIVEHRNSYVTAADFALLARAGINAVRLGVGYWVMAETQDEAAPFVEGAYKYVDKALQWGLQYGIGVLIELHAAHGSQNGQDNSAPARQGHVGWNDVQPSPSYPDQALVVIEAMAARWGSAPALLGFGLLNEPLVKNVGMLQSYYYAAYAAVRKYAPDCFVAISPREWEQDGAAWQFFMAAPPYTKVIQDLHRYQVSFAGPQFAAMTPQQHVDYAQTVEKQLYKGYIAKGGLPPVFGEWALAGIPYGPTLDDMVDQVRSFYDAQASAYLQPGSAGWFQWSYKNDNSVWGFYTPLTSGWINATNVGIVIR